MGRGRLRLRDPRAGEEEQSFRATCIARISTGTGVEADCSWTLKDCAEALEELECPGTRSEFLLLAEETWSSLCQGVRPRPSQVTLQAGHNTGGEGGPQIRADWKIPGR